VQVLVASTVMPFVEGGGTFIVDWLCEALQEHGHDVDVLRLPFRLTTPGMPARLVGMRLFDIEDHGDRLITVRYPSHLLRHPAKVAWFIHHHRPLFDLWGSQHQDVRGDGEGDTYREMLRSADHRGLSEARHVYTNSKVMRDRLQRYNGIDGSVLYPPVWKPERFRTDGYGDFVFYPSRITGHKRQWLAIEAMAHVTTPVRLVLGGQYDDVAYEKTLTRLIADLGVEDRVSMLDRWIDEDDKIDLFASCLAVAYIPLDEDSYGFPSLEAHHAGKAVITTTDGGGTLELVIDGLNGLVSKPDPVALAACFDQLWEDRQLAQRLGEAGDRRIRELDIDWTTTIQRLLV
jgi:glycosyltransferase involved in cell wall biosynthesis